MIKDIIFEQGYEAFSPVDHDKRVQDLILQLELVISGQFDAAQTEIKELEELASETRDERDALDRRCYVLQCVINDALASLESGNLPDALKFLRDVEV